MAARTTRLQMRVQTHSVRDMVFNQPYQGVDHDGRALSYSSEVAFKGECGYDVGA